MSHHFIEYTGTLAKCMMAYQFIEEGLKFCLYRCHAVVRFRLWGLIPYDVPMKSIDNSALGRLIGQYKTFTKNEGLLTALKTIEKHRNYCAHKGYVLTSAEQSDSNYLTEKNEELNEFLISAEECIKLLNIEMEVLDKKVEEVYVELRSRNINLDEVHVVPPLK